MANNKTKKIIIMHNKFGPYHCARLNTVSRMGKGLGIELVGVELASREYIHPWDPYDMSQEVKKFTIFPDRAIEELYSLPLVWKTWRLLNLIDPYATALSLNRQTISALLTVLIWTKLHKRLVILMMDSKLDDFPRSLLKERVKQKIISQFNGVFVAGTFSKAYAKILGIPSHKIVVGYDVVDNDYFFQQSEMVRKNAPFVRQQYYLPENFFLVVSRFYEKKNIAFLLKAYARYCHYRGNEPWGLVICGSGPLEDVIKNKAIELGLQQIHFPGFKQFHELPVYYGLANCFILPSSKSEQWGLVVNEAMASGLPVLVSSACGCAPDIVQNGINGLYF